MDLIENITQKTQQDTKKTSLVNLQLSHTIDGTVLFLKSEPFENFFKINGIHGTYIEDNDGKRTQSYGFATLANRDDNKKLSYFEANLKSYDGIDNFGFIRAVGISKGIKIKLSGVHSRDATNMYIKNFKEFVLKFHDLYMSNQNVELEISIMEKNA